MSEVTIYAVETVPVDCVAIQWDGELESVGSVGAWINNIVMNAPVLVRPSTGDRIHVHTTFETNEKFRKTLTIDLISRQLGANDWLVFYIADQRFVVYSDEDYKKTFRPKVED